MAGGWPIGEEQKMIDGKTISPLHDDEVLQEWRARRSEFGDDARFLAHIARELSHRAAEYFVAEGWLEGGRALISRLTGLEVRVDDGSNPDYLPHEPTGATIRSYEEWHGIDLDDSVNLSLWVHDPDHRVDWFVARVIEIIASLMSFERWVECRARDASDDPESRFVSALLSGDDLPVDAETLVGAIPCDSVRVALLLCDTEHSPDLEQVRLAGRRADVRLMVGLIEGHVVVLLCDVDSARLLMEALATIDTGFDAEFAVSSARPSLTELDGALAEAHHTASRRTIGGGGRVHTFDDLGVLRLFTSDEHTQLLERFVGETIGPLLDYDATHSGDLTATLDAYLRRNSSLDDLASSLHIHRSSLVYRLRRIREVLGFDIDDPSRRVELLLAAHAAVRDQHPPPR